MKTILNRLREPSTWAGFAALGSLFGAPANSVQLLQQVVVGVAGLVAIFAPEKAA